MKKIKAYLIILLLLVVGVSCFEENEFKIPDNMAWIGFAENAITVAEDSGEDVTVKFIVSSAPLTSALTLSYTVTSNDASEGVDYSLPSGSGTFTVPAGASSVDVVLIQSVLNNDNVTGDRFVTFEVTDGNGYIIGGPDGRFTASVLVTLREDDFTTFGYTGFEEPVVSASGIYNVPDAGTPEGTSLPNLSGDNNPVDHVSTGGELGFNLYYTDGDPGGADDIHLGVINITDFGDDIGGFLDGSQGYISEDCDGELNLEFDEITIPDNLSILLVEIGFNFVTGSSFEEDDYFIAIWRTEDGDEELFEITGGNGAGVDEVYSPDGESMIGKWTVLTDEIDNIKTGKLIITFRTSSGGEFSYFDKISIKGF